MMSHTEEQKMIYAPILIPTLCRDKHLIRCIESLKRNTWAKYTDIYVAVDYPIKDTHFEGYKRVCEYLDGDFSEFASFNVVKRQENYGSSRNMRELRNAVLEKYDRFIRTDDDIEFSPNFIEYMNKTLMHYESDDSIVAVTGYSFPINWEASPNSTVIKEKLVAPMWGTGFWKNKYNKLVDYINGGGLLEAFERKEIRCKFKEMTQAAVCDYISSYVSENPENSIICRLTDITLRVYLGIENRYCISPIVSKARNWGNDGSGISCPNIEDVPEGKTAFTYKYSSQPIDEEKSFELRESSCSYNEINLQKFNKFNDVSRAKYIVANIRLFLLKFLGKHLYEKIIKSAKSIFRK